ncbi:hypothetical protein DSO57_1021764 [Entomophthora muscae]|uniref:Uncharacterized protein n=1 Tax=Entomophthora muscae TaxID=34485 RepID=A0ACC2TQR5_9FUNG|nr:hypothetical protein DSO57_1021764 [Entomophthora muscae]
MALALMSFHSNSPHPCGSFYEEGGQPLDESSAPAFTAANTHTGERAGAPYGLPTLSHFMPEHQQPQAMGYQQPLMSCPAPKERLLSYCIYLFLL